MGFSLKDEESGRRPGCVYPVAGDIAYLYILTMSNITYTRKALKGLRKLPPKTAHAFRKAFDMIANAQHQDLDVKRLQGRAGHRLRIGKYRAIYEIRGERIEILVIDIGSRGGIYK